jgi:hypothetical protein
VKQVDERRVDVFFYGLFMDRQLLQGKGAQPTEVRLASVRGFELRIGARASLVPAAGGEVHGMLMRLTQPDLEKLYAEPSVQLYRPEPVLAMTRDGSTVVALCYNLPVPPDPAERNAEYSSKLRALAQRLGLPAEYIASIS